MRMPGMPWIRDLTVTYGKFYFKTIFDGNLVTIQSLIAMSQYSA